MASKTVVTTCELAKAVGANVTEMNQQHWYRVAFDLIWLWIAFYEINQSADLPMDNRNLNASRLVSNTMGIALIIAVFQALANYVLFNESTNLTSMILMLGLLPLVLRSIFSGFRAVQDSVYPQVEEVIEVEEPAPGRSLLSYVGSFFSRRPERQLGNANMAPEFQ